MIEKSNYRLEYEGSTRNLLIGLQSQIRKGSQKTLSFRKIILHYFYQGVRVDIRRKPNTVQELFNNASELIRLESEFTPFDQDMNQVSIENGLQAGETVDKSKLLQSDLIDQFYILRSKELRLMKNEADLEKRIAKIPEYEKNDKEKSFKIQVLELRINSLESKNESTKRFSDLFEKQVEMKDKELDEIRKDNRNLASAVRKIKNDIKTILSNTNKLVRSDENLFNKVLKSAGPAIGSFFGSSEGVKKAMKDFKKIES